MNNFSIFGQITKEKLDALQKQEEYATCYQMYQQSNLDENSPEIRNIKSLLYQTLASYLIYDPQLDKELAQANITPDTSIFNSISTTDPKYEDKICAILLVLFYCIKNRSYNYALEVNASHNEISQSKYLRDWLESNADSIICGKPKIKSLLSALLTLIYDKILSATVELVHLGKNVPSSITTYHVGSAYSYSEINYRNTTKTQKINALNLICMDGHRSEYIDRRNYWRQNASNTKFQENKNVFLFGTYNLKEMNSFLAQFDFKLFDIATKYYENYFCHFINPFTVCLAPLKKVFFLLTDNQKQMESITKKHRDWPLSLIIKSFCKVFLAALIIGIIPFLLLLPFGESYAMIFSILAACIAFTPPFNKMFEKSKRTIFSLLQ